MAFKVKLRHCGKSFKSFDQFTEPIQLTHEGGKPAFQTRVGAFFSLVMIVSVLAFGVKRMIEMFQYVNADIKVTTLEDFHSADYIYTGSDQLWFAVAMADESSKVFDAKLYGTFKFWVLEWNAEDFAYRELR